MICLLEYGPHLFLNSATKDILLPRTASQVLYSDGISVEFIKRFFNETTYVLDDSPSQIYYSSGAFKIQNISFQVSDLIRKRYILKKTFQNINLTNALCVKSGEERRSSDIGIRFSAITGCK